ncbi:hypothetical protein CaCOL14_013108 [Colletotrichum acutatum]
MQLALESVVPLISAQARAFGRLTLAMSIPRLKFSESIYLPHGPTSAISTSSFSQAKQLIANSTPPNVRFEIDDVEDTWTFSQPFDYIHSRVMTSSVKSWEDFIRKCFENLSPGGYLELNEIDPCPLSDDGTLKETSAIIKSVRMLEQAANIFGRPYHTAQALQETLTKVGFEDVTVQRFKWPTNPWPRDALYRELGVWTHENLVAGWEGFCMAPFTRALNWSREEVLVLMMQVRKEFSDRSIHAYFPV